jgi:tripartite-type tricarboxylate transporter receptor subunit TctC
MKKFTRNCTACAIALTLASMVMPLSAAAAYPERLVQMILPVGVGGGTDLLARQLAKQLSEIWGQAAAASSRRYQ